MTADVFYEILPMLTSSEKCHSQTREDKGLHNTQVSNVSLVESRRNRDFPSGQTVARVQCAGSHWSSVGSELSVVGANTLVAISGLWAKVKSACESTSTECASSSRHRSIARRTRGETPFPGSILSCPIIRFQ